MWGLQANTAGRLGGCALALSVALIGASAATQMLAARFEHQAALGARWSVAGSALYPPWAVFGWSERWSEFYPRAFALPKLIAVFGLIGAGLIGFLVFRPTRPDERPFGKAAWGGLKDAAAAGLLAPSGAVLGKLKGEILVADGPHHVLLTGGTRSGKTRGCVVPTILACPHSLIVLDLKGELYGGDPRFAFAGTAGWRARLGPVFRFAPTESQSDTINLIDTIRPGAQEVRDTQNMVELIADPHGDGRFQEFWDRAAKQILVGLILHVAYAEAPEHKTLARVFELLARFDDTAKTMAATLHRRNHDTGAPETHPEVLRAAHSYGAYHDKLRAGIKATAESYLGLFADPLVRRNTATSSFALSDLMCADKPATLYLCWPPNDAKRVKPILRNVFAALLRMLMEDQTRAADGRMKRQRLVMVLDEFPQLGKLDVFEQAMGAMAGYGLTATLVTQSLHQVTQAYGRNHTILDNVHIVTSFAATDVETAETVSKLAGDIYEMRPQETWSGKRGALGMDHRAITYREERRPLILPAEVRRLPDRDELIFVTGAKPIRARKLRYDEEPVFVRRLISPPHVAERAPIPSPWAQMRALASPESGSSAQRAPADAPASRPMHAPLRSRARAAQAAGAPQPDLFNVLDTPRPSAPPPAPTNESAAATNGRVGFDLRPRGDPGLAAEGDA